MQSGFLWPQMIGCEDELTTMWAIGMAVEAEAVHGTQCSLTAHGVSRHALPPHTQSPAQTLTRGLQLY